MLNQYLNDEDVRLRLSDTYIRYKGTPYFVNCIGDKKLMLFVPPDWHKPAYNGVSANSPDIDVTSIEVGYVNCARSVLFVSRGSVRNQKQGLCCENLFDDLTGQYIDGNTFSSPEFYAMLCDKYPSFNECLVGPRSITAFHKSFALKKANNTMQILFKGEACADYKDKRFVVIDEGDTIMPMYLARMGVPI